jgi:hypothetical protein
MFCVVFSGVPKKNLFLLASLMKYVVKNQRWLMKFPHVIVGTEKCNGCSRALSVGSERGSRDRGGFGSSARAGRWGRWGPRGQTALRPTREDDKYPSIRHCQAAARSELDAMQTHRKLCNIGYG